jgi:hypothetical protein
MPLTCQHPTRCPPRPDPSAGIAVPDFSYCTNCTDVDVWTGKVWAPPFSIRPLKISRNPMPLLWLLLLSNTLGVK